MAFATGSGKGQPMADINVTPLVDVMLVLLIIFIVTAPVMTYPDRRRPAAARDQPAAAAARAAAADRAEDRRLRPGDLEQQRRSRSAPCSTMMENEVQRDPTNQPLLQIDANPDAQYDVMAKVLAAAKNAQMQKIGFVQQAVSSGRALDRENSFHAAFGRRVRLRIRATPRRGAAGCAMRVPAGVAWGHPPTQECAMAFSAAVRDSAVAEMNITPLVDVMLVLLVIFMVTAPLLARPVDASLPQTSRPITTAAAGH